MIKITIDPDTLTASFEWEGVSMDLDDVQVQLRRPALELDWRATNEAGDGLAHWKVSGDRAFQIEIKGTRR